MNTSRRVYAYLLFSAALLTCLSQVADVAAQSPAPSIRELVNQHLEIGRAHV